MFNQKSILIIFIDRSGFQFYRGNLQPIVSVQIPPTVMQDLDVLSKDGLYSLIKQWVKDHSLVGFQIVFIFSETVYVEKLFSTAEHAQVESDILKFFDMVPYESIWSKVYPTKNGKRAVAFNKSFYEAIHQGFLLQGLPTKSVLPAFALGPHEKKHALDAQLALYVIENLDQLTKASLLDTQESISSIPISSDPNYVTTSKQKSSLPLLLGIFGVLLAILGVVAYIQF